jgi:hypothetical protein
MIENKLDIKKIADKEEKLDVMGQGCWDDCRIWANYTSTPKCEYNKTPYNNPFL